MLDSKAFRTLSYGLYVIATKVDGKTSGCTVNTFAQLTSQPYQVSVAVNKENYTCSAIKKAGKYTAIVLAEETTMEFIGTFGFHSSSEMDKFEGYTTEVDEAGMPYIAEHAVARFSVDVTNTLDVGTHMLFVGTVTEAEVYGSTNPMTYSYYHEVKGGKTPPKASSYIIEEEEVITMSNESTQKAWRCTICGHIEYADELPDDFECPVCGAGKESFELVED